MSKGIHNLEKNPINSITSPHKEIERILNSNERYVENHILPKITDNLDNYSIDIQCIYKDCCQGTILVRTLSVLDFVVIEGYQAPNDDEYLVIERDDNSIYLFFLYHCKDYNPIRYVVYPIHCLDWLKQLKKSQFSGKKISELVKLSNIPYVCEMPELFLKLCYLI